MNTFYQMKPDRYVSRKLYRDVTGEQNRQAVKEALKDDDGYYRTEQMESDDENAADLNRIWDVDQNITSIYSSAYNPDYQTFRQKTFGLEETVPQWDDAVCFEKSGISTDDGSTVYRIRFGCARIYSG